MVGSKSAASEIAVAAEPRRTGRIEHGGRAIALEAVPDGRLALAVELGGGARLEDGVELPRVEVDVEGGTIALGRCRFTSERAGAASSSGRLVFVDDVYDCRALVEDGKFVDLRGFFQNLPLVLAQRERIRPEFQRYCANLAYDLAVYRRFFDEQDRIIAGERAEIADAARDALRRTEGRRFMSFLDAKLEELAALVRGYGPEEHEQHGYYLRRALWPYIAGATFLRHTNVKPRGYAGDAEAMQMAYANAYVGDGLFNQLLHKHPLETQAAEAVRGRRKLVVRVLREVLARFPGLPRHGFRFLSLASGPASEMADLFLDREDLDRFHCEFLDQDADALEMARRTLHEVEQRLRGRVDARYVSESVRTMLRARAGSDRLGRYHVVYSMGLFDYLTPPVARAVLARAFDLLLPGGTLVVGNYHVSNQTRLYMDYWMDWPLYYRTEENFLGLAEGLPATHVSLGFDETGCQMFLRLDRPAEPAA
jgi:extracellular factor (EF) 3-hydroxypalmitic acid methyl ester biosynthesis protein